MEFLAAIVASSEDAIIGKNLDGIVTSWNAAAERIFGYSAREMIGRSISILIPEGQANEEPEILRRIRAGERIQHYETKRRAKDGRILDLSLSISPIRDETGRIVGASKIARDVTAQKRAELQRAEERAKELAQLRELNDFKAHFINTAGHALRTPLMPIRSVLHVLPSSGPLTQKQREALKLLGRNVDRLAGVVEDMLVIARQQVGALGLESRQFDLSRLIHETVESFRPSFGTKNIALSWKPPGSVPIVGDRKRLGDVVSNLISNAVKFTPEGGTIRVTLRPRKEDVVVSVQDSGVGIPPAGLPRLFQPFVQVHDPLKHTTTGSGLGLYISRTFVELHGGRIEADSPGLGRGSTFTFTVPKRPDRAATKRSARAGRRRVERPSRSPRDECPWR